MVRVHYQPVFVLSIGLVLFRLHSMANMAGSMVYDVQWPEPSQVKMFDPSAWALPKIRSESYPSGRRPHEAEWRRRSPSGAPPPGDWCPSAPIGGETGKDLCAVAVILRHPGGAAFQIIIGPKILLAEQERVRRAVARNVGIGHHAQSRNNAVGIDARIRIRNASRVDDAGIAAFGHVAPLCQLDLGSFLRWRRSRNERGVRCRRLHELHVVFDRGYTHGRPPRGAIERRDRLLAPLDRAELCWPPAAVPMPISCTGCCSINGKMLYVQPPGWVWPVP